MRPGEGEVRVRVRVMPGGGGGGGGGGGDSSMPGCVCPKVKDMEYFFGLK